MPMKTKHPMMGNSPLGSFNRAYYWSKKDDTIASANAINKIQ
jgi:hypothetical protein